LNFKNALKWLYSLFLNTKALELWFEVKIAEKFETKPTIRPFKKNSLLFLYFSESIEM
jgi:hypothetical protein